MTEVLSIIPTFTSTHLEGRSCSSSSSHYISKETLVYCTLCLDDLEASKFICAFTCPHRFCSSCLGEFFSVHIKEGTLECLVCPDCKNSNFLPSVIQQLVSEEIYERFDNVAFNRALDRMRDLYYCPNCNTPVVADNEGHNYGHCSKCDFCFCIDCKERWHSGRCGEVYIMIGQNYPGLDQMKNWEKEDKILLASMTKRCPKCSVHIE